MTHPLEIFRIVFFFVSLIHVAYRILKTDKVPLADTVICVIIGMVLLILHKGVPGLISGILFFTIGFFPFYILYMLKGLQLGEAILMGLVGTIGGGEILLNTFVYAAVLGFMASLAVLARHRQLRHLAGRIRHVFLKSAHPDRFSSPTAQHAFTELTIPYGLIIIVSAYASFIVMVI